MSSTWSIHTSVLARWFFVLAELVCDSWRRRFRSNSNCSLHFWFCSRRCWFCSSSCRNSTHTKKGKQLIQNSGTLDTKHRRFNDLIELFLIHLDEGKKNWVIKQKGRKYSKLNAGFFGFRLVGLCTRGSLSRTPSCRSCGPLARGHYRPSRHFDRNASTLWTMNIERTLLVGW